MRARINRRSKFNAKPVTIDGLRFASTAEGRRYQELKLLEAAGEIRGLRVHPRYELAVKGKRVGLYIADFSYWDMKPPGAFRGPVWRVEDVKGCTKGPAYDLFRLKAAILKASEGIEVVEVKA